METFDNTAPFPQANDFDKVIKVMNVENEECLKDTKHMMIWLGDISDRQVDYYISAAKYLKLIDSNKKFTQLGKNVRNMNRTEQKVEFARILCTIPVIGQVYFTEKIFEDKADNDFIIETMKRCGVSFSGEPMYKRRASTIKRWVGWLNENFNDGFASKYNKEIDEEWGMVAESD